MPLDKEQIELAEKNLLSELLQHFTTNSFPYGKDKFFSIFRSIWHSIDFKYVIFKVFFFTKNGYCTMSVNSEYLIRKKIEFFMMLTMAVWLFE